MISYYLEQSGKFELVDAETEEILIDQTHLKDAGLLYSQHLDDDGKTEYHVFLQLKFDKEGTTIINELNKNYVKKTETVEEDGETKEQSVSKELTILLNGTSMGTTIMTNIFYNNTVAIPLGSSTDSAEFTQISENASNIVNILKNGAMPIVYNQEETTEENVNNLFEIYELVFLTIQIIICIYLIARFKIKGMLASMLSIGFLCTELIVLRYTNVIITETRNDRNNSFRTN